MAILKKKKVVKTVIKPVVKDGLVDLTAIDFIVCGIRFYVVGFSLVLD